MLPSFYAEQKKKKTQSGQIAVNLLVFALLLFLGLVYLIQINGLVGQDYAIKKNNNDLELLEIENKKLKVEIAQLQSLPRLQEAVRDFSLVAADDIVYLGRPKGKVVAR